MTQKETLTELISRIQSEVCDYLCKYNESIDENGECQYQIEEGRCPLDDLL